jgi:hypothetical protein
MLGVEITDERGVRTPAAAGLYAPDGQLVVPPAAIPFDEAGEFYRRGRVRTYREPRFWPAVEGRQHAFFVDGSFEVAVSEGEYTLTVGKGFE